MMIGLEHYLILAALLFAIGLYGVVASRNIIRVLMSVEVMLNAVNINFVAFTYYCDFNDMTGHIFALFIMAIAAAEASVGLAIILSLFKNTPTVDTDRFSLLKF